MSLLPLLVDWCLMSVFIAVAVAAAAAVVVVVAPAAVNVAVVVAAITDAAAGNAVGGQEEEVRISCGMKVILYQSFVLRFIEPLPRPAPTL